jgi:hypothetical protein
MAIKRSVPQSVFDSKDALHIQRQATKEATDKLNQTPVDQLDVGNPNHPINSGLFGYGLTEFLNKQYGK